MFYIISISLPQSLLIKIISHKCDFYVTEQNSKAQSELMHFTFGGLYSPLEATLWQMQEKKSVCVHCTHNMKIKLSQVGGAKISTTSSLQVCDR